ncbi:glutathione S-transferase family protein [Albimonas sp. CAU 1670]|uniref:glutathione S-transferase family protein n=1 Tax=Albimonas sp. CAU 1670 TaxID=3032599 RepID=UPI0023D9DC4D|nr:glutathione S-transferase family protein [Albimonas sp. CAU 1670]MDF2232347.1 glutathione S-transferase family protein [Albimonas sp. CAU 1670]
MYTIVGNPRNRSLRVMWALEEMGQDWSMELVGPQTERMLAVNATGKAPVLLVDGEPVADSVAIVTFLADRHGALTFPAGTLERARQDAAVQFCVDELEGACWTAAKNEFIHPEDKRSPVKPTCAYEFELAQKRLERMLGKGPWVMGETFTIADILIAHTLSWGERMFQWPLTEKLAAYKDRAMSRPALGAAMAKGKAAMEAAA